MKKILKVVSQGEAFDVHSLAYHPAFQAPLVGEVVGLCIRSSQVGL